MYSCTKHVQSVKVSDLSQQVVYHRCHSERVCLSEESSEGISLKFGDDFADSPCIY